MNPNGMKKVEEAFTRGGGAVTHKPGSGASKEAGPDVKVKVVLF